MIMIKPDSIEDKMRVQRLYAYEDLARNQGYNLIAGVDEAGRGSLIGCMTVAAVILPPDFYIAKLNDSKKLSAHQRNKIFDDILENCISYNCVEVSVEEIDSLNIYQATLVGMKRAVAGLKIQPDFVLTDAMKVEFKSIPTQSIVHGDALSASIAAASVIAKVTRDRLTDDWDKKFPQYNLNHNRGYGTKAHISAIKKFGPCELHRKSFNPVKQLLGIKNLTSANV